jgi:hypothetical protein
MYPLIFFNLTLDLSDNTHLVLQIAYKCPLLYIYRHVLNPSVKHVTNASPCPVLCRVHKNLLPSLILNQLVFPPLEEVLLRHVMTAPGTEGQYALASQLVTPLQALIMLILLLYMVRQGAYSGLMMTEVGDKGILVRF